MSVDLREPLIIAFPPVAPPRRDDRRVFYVDALRSCASILVVSSHVFAPICSAMNKYSLGQWWIFNLLDSVIRICVPIYLMISGKLFLGAARDVAYGTFLWRRYSRLVPAFFVWSMIYAFVEAHANEMPFSFRASVTQMLRDPAEYHLWFMYVILALYLVMPFMRRLVRVTPMRELALLLGVWLAYLTVQFFFPGFGGTGGVIQCLNYAGYPILGYVLDQSHFFDRKTRAVSTTAVGIILFNALATFVLTANNGGVLDERFYFGTAPLVAIYAAAAFVIFKNASRDSFFYQVPWVRKGVAALSGQSYNVYLIHAFFIVLFTNGYLGFYLSEHTGGSPLMGVFLTSLAVMASSYGLARAFQKLPYFSRLFVIS